MNSNLTATFNGNFKEAQKQAIEKAKEHLRKGDHFIMT